MIYMIMIIYSNFLQMMHRLFSMNPDTNTSVTKVLNKHLEKKCSMSVQIENEH